MSLDDRPREAADDRRIAAWLDDGPETAPPEFVAATLAPIPMMAQRRRSVVAVGRLTVSVGTLARLAVAAAIVAVTVGLGGLLLQRSASTVGGPVVSPTPTPSAPTTTPGPLPSGVSYTNAGPLGASLGSDPGKAGTYQTLQARPAFRFTVPAGWSVGQIVNTFVGADETANGIPLTDGAGVVVVTAPTSIYPPAPGDPGSPVPADLLATLAKDPKLSLGPVTPVTIGGIAGTQIEGTVKADVQTGEDSGYRISDYLLAKPGNHVRFAQVTVGGRPVIVMSSAAPGAWTSFKADADALIGSIAFQP